MKKLKQILAISVLILSIFVVQNYLLSGVGEINSTLEQLIEKRESGKIITINASVIKVLKDDLKGDKHQKIILKVGDYQTLLLAHNIDIAPRVPVKKGNKIEVKGQYEWNDKGGVIHWTHIDKNNKHPDGWVKFNNIKYQ